MRVLSEETKEKIRKGVKEDYQENPRDYSDFYITKTCPMCGIGFSVKKHKKDKIYCSQKCYNEDKHCKYRKYNKNGLSKNGYGKKGWYKGYWCDSLYELAWIINCLENNINFKRNTDYFEYIWPDESIHRYYPDFILEDGTYIEIKEFFRQLDYLKITQFPKTLKILDKKIILPLINKLKQKYGKDLSKLYEQCLVE